jgi:hypothetical protein
MVRKKTAVSKKVVTKDDVIYQIKITLRHVEPPVWRTFAVWGSIPLDVLHLIIQEVMGWTDSHLHQFIINKKCYQSERALAMDDFGGADIAVEEDVILASVITKSGTSFGYEYDFGDSWEHILKVQKIGPPEAGIKYPVCLAGARACPPEDCGGVWGYADLLEAISDPEHPEHENLLEWLGDDFDPEQFDLRKINRWLGAISDKK